MNKTHERTKDDDLTMEEDGVATEAGDGYGRRTSIRHGSTPETAQTVYRRTEVERYTATRLAYWLANRCSATQSFLLFDIPHFYSRLADY